MTVELVISGKLLNSTKDEVHQLVIEACKKVADELKEAIKREFENSVELNAMIGQYTDQESLRAILRSVKVSLTNDWPPNFDLKFEDDLSHWYGGGELPPEFIDAINKVYDSALDKWFSTPQFENILLETVEL